MTLKYKLFGIPGTSDEFVDKVKRRNIHEVDVSPWEYDDQGSLFPPHLESYNHQGITLKAENVQLKLCDYTQSRLGYQPAVIMGLAKLTNKVAKEAIDVAKRLQSLDLEVTINSFSIEEAEERVKGQDEYIKELRLKTGCA